MPDIGISRNLMYGQILTVADLDFHTTGSSLGEFAVAETEKLQHEYHGIGLIFNITVEPCKI